MATKHQPSTSSDSPVSSQQPAVLAFPIVQAAVKVRRHVWTDEYIGTADQLVEAGLLKVGQFPGEPGRGKTMVSYTADGEPAARGAAKNAGYRQVRRVSRNQFSVDVWIDEKEGRRRLAEEQERMGKARLELESNAELKRQVARLRELPETPEAYAKRAADLLWVGIETFFRSHCGSEPHESGYSFSASDTEDFAEMARALYWKIRETKAPKFNHEYRERKVTAARAKAAKEDLPLQRLLRAVGQ